MTTTFDTLVDEVILNLSGYTFQQDRATHLIADVTASSSTIDAPIILSLGSTESVGKGVLEVGEELIWVDSYDRIANTANVSPYGRGYMGTTKAAHSRGDKVTIAPIFPRFVIKRAINDTLRAMAASMFSVRNTTFTFNPAVTTYGFTGLNIKNIISISWQAIGPSKEWIPVRHWEIDNYADVTTWGANSQTLTIGDDITSGRTVKVIYGTDPSIVDEAATTSFGVATGLPESSKDVVIYGAAYRLLAFLDPARAAQVSPQADETDSKRPYGASNQAVKQLYALFQQRLNEEAQDQQRQYPPRVHYSRR